MPRYQSGDQLGSWLLASFLNEGRNAFVWKLRDERPLVIKILKTKDPASEMYLRFRDEIAIHGRLGESRGVLPMIDSNLPDKPSHSNPAWIVFPEAEPLRKALAEASFELIAAHADHPTLVFPRYGNRVIEPELKGAFAALFVLMYFAAKAQSHSVLPAFILGLGLARSSRRHGSWRLQMLSVLSGPLSCVSRPKIIIAGFSWVYGCHSGMFISLWLGSPFLARLAKAVVN
jgi:hypothetical protein